METWPDLNVYQSATTRTPIPSVLVGFFGLFLLGALCGSSQAGSAELDQVQVTNLVEVSTFVGTGTVSDTTYLYGNPAKTRIDVDVDAVYLGESTSTVSFVVTGGRDDWGFLVSEELSHFQIGHQYLQFLGRCERYDRNQLLSRRFSGEIVGQDIRYGPAAVSLVERIDQIAERVATQDIASIRSRTTLSIHGELLDSEVSRRSTYDQSGRFRVIVSDVLDVASPYTVEPGDTVTVRIDPAGESTTGGVASPVGSFSEGQHLTMCLHHDGVEWVAPLTPYCTWWHSADGETASVFVQSPSCFGSLNALRTLTIQDLNSEFTQ